MQDKIDMAELREVENTLIRLENNMNKYNRDEKYLHYYKQRVTKVIELVTKFNFFNSSPEGEILKIIICDLNTCDSAYMLYTKLDNAIIQVSHMLDKITEEYIKNAT